MAILVATDISICFLLRVLDSTTWLGTANKHTTTSLHADDKQFLNSWIWTLELTYDLDDNDEVLALQQPKLQTVFLHSFRFHIRQDNWIIDILRSSQSSRILSSHFFFGLPLDRCPCVWPWSSIFGKLSLPIRFTCPKYVNLRAFNKSTMSFSIHNSFIVSTFLLPSFLVIPQIFLSTDISNTLNFLLWCSFRVNVSELYRMIDWIWLENNTANNQLLNGTVVNAHWIQLGNEYTDIWVMCSDMKFYYKKLLKTVYGAKWPSKERC